MISSEQLTRSIHAIHIAVPIESAFCLQPTWDVRTAAEELRVRNFDQAPVEAEGRVTGFALKRALLAAPDRTTVAQVEVALGVGNVVSADASLGDVLGGILEPGLIFVFDGMSLAGFVTVSDFNKQPARAYLYLLVASVEMGISELLRGLHGTEQEQALAYLTPQRAGQIRREHEKRTAANSESDLVACLTFRDLLRIALMHPALQVVLGDTRRALEDQTEDLVDMRNYVMHPSDLMIGEKAGLIRLREREQLARTIRDRLEAAAQGTG